MNNLLQPSIMTNYHNDDLIIDFYSDWFCNQTDKEANLMMDIIFQEKLFDDMCFFKNSITGDYMIHNGEYKVFKNGLSLDEQFFRIIIDNTKEYDAYTDISDKKIVIDEKHIDNKATILHEMIHAHEYILQNQKPIDLDIRCGFELLTVFGYDYIRNFKELELL